MTPGTWFEQTLICTPKALCMQNIKTLANLVHKKIFKNTLPPGFGLIYDPRDLVWTTFNLHYKDNVHAKDQTFGF